MANFLTTIINEIKIFIQPLEQIIDTLPELKYCRFFLAKIIPNATISSDESVISCFICIKELINHLTSISSENITEEDGIKNIIEILRSFKDFNFGDIICDDDITDISSIATNLLSYLVGRYILYRFPVIHGLLCLFKIIEYKDEIPEFRLNRIFEIIANPIIITSYYEWGTRQFKIESLIKNIVHLANSANFRSMFDFTDDVELDYSDSEYSEFSPSISIFRATRIKLISLKSTSEAGNDAGFGFVIMPEGNIEFQYDFISNWKFLLKITGLDQAALVLKLWPHKSIEFGLLNDQLIDKITIKIDIENEPDHGITIIDTTAPEIKLLIEHLLVTFQLLFDTGINFEIGLNLDNILFRLSVNEGDSFLRKILGNNTIEFLFSLGIGYSSLTGLYFRGSAALDIVIPIHKKLGPIVIDEIILTIGIDGRNIPVTIRASFGAEMGVISAHVEKIGIRFPIGFPEDRNGNLGPLNIDAPAFVPPTGAGLAISAGPVTGGGYVEFDNENKQYAGILQLQFAKIGLTAIGLITTRMPDGSDGFSMLVVICVTFNPAITLPYNFNISGVGGLIGINRSMNIDFLRDGIKNKTLDSILFPQDPIANAATIISNLRQAFPVAEGRFVVGPMAIIGWSNIVKAEVGIFIEVPSPIRIVIMGQLTAKLPNADAQEEIVVIHMDVLGVLDFEKKLFSLDASIYDSKILCFALSGDMAMRFSWGSPPTFLISFGGFNPRWVAPPGTPVLRRMMLSLGEGDNPRLSLECYMAVTTNSFQFGARLELEAHAGDFRVHGYLYFDALFIFSPFSFIVELGAGVEVYCGSTCLLCIALDLSLAGPTPWHATGTAKIEILFFDIKVHFDKKWGREDATTLPAENPWDDLYAALINPENWKAILPDERESLIQLKKIEKTTAAEGTGGTEETTQEELVLIHPRGRLEISQKVIPFNMPLQKYGNSPILGDATYYVSEYSGIQYTDPSFKEKLNYGKEYFGRYQFTEGNDADKLSAPSFEEMQANIVIGSDEVAIGTPLKYDLTYETVIIDENRVAYKFGYTGLSWKKGGLFLKGRARTDGSTGMKKFGTGMKDPLVKVANGKYSIVTKDTFKDIESDIDSYTTAEAKISKYISEHPEQAGNIQIMHESEKIA